LSTTALSDSFRLIGAASLGRLEVGFKISGDGAGSLFATDNGVWAEPVMETESNVIRKKQVGDIDLRVVMDKTPWGMNSRLWIKAGPCGGRKGPASSLCGEK